jgi:hypothetical protein
MFTVVGTGWILPIVSTLSRPILSSEIYDAGLRRRLCGSVESVANTSRTPTSTNGHDELHCSNITELLP